MSLLFLITTSATSQTFRAMFLNPNVYRTYTNFEAIRLSDHQNNIYNDKLIVDVEGGYMDYKIISEDENGYIIIKVLPQVVYENISTASGNLYRIRRAVNGESIVDNGYNYYLAVKQGEFRPLAKTLLTTKIVGVPLIHPFKLRPKNNDVDWDIQPEFSISYSFGIRIKVGKRFSPNYVTLIPYGFGIGSTKYFVNANDEKKDGVSITYCQSGIMYSFGKVNVGAFVGFDAMISKRNDWIYQGNSWYSFGIGYKFKND